MESLNKSLKIKEHEITLELLVYENNCWADLTLIKETSKGNYKKTSLHRCVGPGPERKFE